MHCLIFPISSPAPYHLFSPSPHSFLPSLSPSPISPYSVFFKQVEFYSDHPERVGTCFIQHVCQYNAVHVLFINNCLFQSKEFQLYSEYCRNRPNSEALLTQSPECKSFFKEIQIRLAHQLPLNSYLIKPIQRVTKYQLLLKVTCCYVTRTCISSHVLELFSI